MSPTSRVHEKVKFAELRTCGFLFNDNVSNAYLEAVRLSCARVGQLPVGIGGPLPPMLSGASARHPDSRSTSRLPLKKKTARKENGQAKDCAGSDLGV